MRTVNIVLDTTSIHKHSQTDHVNKIDLTFVIKRHTTSIKDVQSARGSNSDLDLYMVKIKLLENIALAETQTGSRKVK